MKKPEFISQYGIYYLVGLKTLIKKIWYLVHSFEILTELLHYEKWESVVALLKWTNKPSISWESAIAIKSRLDFYFSLINRLTAAKLFITSQTEKVKALNSSHLQEWYCFYFRNLSKRFCKTVYFSLI